jgi:hypothetical protein
MAHIDIDYEKLPQLVKDNLTAGQWREAQREVIADGEGVPDTTTYINLKNGQIHEYAAGQPASGPLLPTHDLSGGHGRDSRQFHTAPAGAHTAHEHGR